MFVFSPPPGEDAQAVAARRALLKVSPPPSGLLARVRRCGPSCFATHALSVTCSRPCALRSAVGGFWYWQSVTAGAWLRCASPPLRARRVTPRRDSYAQGCTCLTRGSSSCAVRCPYTYKRCKSAVRLVLTPSPLHPLMRSVERRCHLLWRGLRPARGVPERRRRHQRGARRARRVARRLVIVVCYAYKEVIACARRALRLVLRTRWTGGSDQKAATSARHASAAARPAPRPTAHAPRPPRIRWHCPAQSAAL